MDIKNEGKKIYDELIKNYIQLGGGAGLAAPQIGIQKKIFIWSPNRTFSTLRVAINPNLVYGNTKTISYESCFSLPKKTYKVTRYTDVQMDFFDLNGNHLKESYSDFEAILLQHEYDHLNGVLISDHGEIFDENKVKIS